jgi:Gluconate 2-dehydrogenase subunit 3
MAVPDPDLLDAVIDRIIPADDDPGALALGTPAYVRARLAEDPALAREIAAGMSSLTNFAALDPAGRDAALRAVEESDWFRQLVELTAEGFWADPGNGGNRDARSWAMIGYRHGLPEGPSGPSAPEA